MILIAGATGTNGIEIVRLLARSGVPCRALVRNAQKAAALAALPKVEIVEGDLADRETLAPAVEGVDKALLCSSIGPTSSSCKEILSAPLNGQEFGTL